MADELWTIRRVLEWTRGHFENKGIESARLDAEVLLAHSLGRDRVSLYLDYDKPLVPDELARFRETVKQRAARKPVHYITGEREFWSLAFKVDQRVLIPRPETEVLVEEVLEHLATSAKDPLRVCDVGTGSGNLAIVLAHELNATILATDSSPKALELARENALLHDLAEKIVFKRCELIPEDAGQFELIVSNPPYIPSNRLRALMPEVAKWEPRGALDGGPDGLTVIRGLVESSLRHLAPNALFCFEFDGAEQESALRLLLDEFPELKLTRIRRDYAGLPRVAVLRMQD